MKLRVNASLPLVMLTVLSTATQLSCTRFSSSDRQADASTLFLQLPGEPVTLDPSLAEDGLGFRIIVNLMDGLMGFDNEGQLRPRLAQEINISADRQTYTFKMNPDARWSDGVKVTSDQIRFALERALNPKTGSKLSGYLRDIDGAAEFMAGKSPTLKGVTASGDTLTVRLKQPVSYFAEVFALPMTYPLRQDVLEKHGGKWDPIRNRNIPTSGAYQVEDYQRDQQIVLKASRPLPPAAPTRILFRVVVDESTGASLFEQKKLDILTRIPAYDQKKYEEKGQVKVVPFHATYFLSFNFKKPPFNDRNYRRAVAGGLRKPELVKALGTGEVVATNWIPPGLPGHVQSPLGNDGRDPRFADSLASVKARGLTAPVLLGLDANGRNTMIMERVQSDLKETLGWKAELKSSDWKTHVREIFSDPPAIYRYGWSSPMRDPISFLTAFQTNDPFSFTHYSNPAFDRIVDELRGMDAGPLREEKIREAQTILVEKDAVVVPLYHYVSTYAVGPRVAKYQVNPYGHTRFEEVEMRR